ncbi:hypothetical protein ACLOJK_022543 [Asimina triloba]
MGIPDVATQVKKYNPEHRQSVEDHLQPQGEKREKLGYAPGKLLVPHHLEDHLEDPCQINVLFKHRLYPINRHGGGIRSMGGDRFSHGEVTHKRHVRLEGSVYSGVKGFITMFFIGSRD